MSYYYNKTVIKGTEETILELQENLISKHGMTTTLNNYKTNPYFTEVIEIKDYEIYGDVDSDDMVLEMNFAALDLPVVKFWESDEFVISDNSIHSIEVKSYNPIDQIYIYNFRNGNTQDDVISKSIMPLHCFGDLNELIEYYNYISEFVSGEKINKLISNIVKNADDEAFIKEALLDKFYNN